MLFTAHTSDGRAVLEVRASNAEKALYSARQCSREVIAFVRVKKEEAVLKDVKVQEPGKFSYVKDDTLHLSSFPLFIISMAWAQGCSMEDLADGFGKGRGTNNGDWSGIRDSSDEAIDRMLERAILHLHPKLKEPSPFAGKKLKFVSIPAPK